MGLEDALPEDVEPASSSTSSNTSSDEDKVVIQGESSKRVFDEDKWERIEDLIREEYEENLNQVLNNWSADERYEFIGKVARHDTRNSHELDQDPGEEIHCDHCGKRVTVVAVELHGYVYCRNHTVGEIHMELDDES